MRLVWMSLYLTAAAVAQVNITASTPVYVAGSEPEALQLAAADLAEDLTNLFGKPVRVVNQAPAGPAIRIGAGLGAPGGSEVLQIRTEDGSVVLTGSDMRGAIYAVYHFSQQFLGVDPFHFWTDHLPQRRDRVVVPQRTNIVDGPPGFRYRGWFTNDEDLLTGWKPGTKDGTGIALEAWDHVFEAILRLKGNMIVPGTFIFPDEPQVRAAGRRGLIITQHHIEVLGTNTYKWPEDKPYAFGSHPQLLINAWRNSMRGYAKNQEIIWTLGYRGRHDRAFWLDDTTVGPTDAERAQAIRNAIDRQIEMVQAERPGGYMLLNAWMESVPFIRQGLLKIPDGVALVWPDNGHGVVRDEGDIGKGHGVYYHTAMYNSRANQLTEMVPLERIQRELGRAARNGGTEYLLINTSDVRPYPLTTRAVMELAWNPRPWVDTARDESKAYLDKWCREEFGPRAAPVLAEYYRAYFSAPGRYGKDEVETLADNAYHTFARHILVGLISGKPEIPTRYFASLGDFNRFAEIMRQAAAEAEPRWAAARKLAEKARPLVPENRRQFFQSHVMTQLDIHEYSNRMLRLVAEAWLDQARRKEKVAAAIGAIQGVLASLEAAEYGKWKGFYKNEIFTLVRHTLALAQGLMRQLEGEPLPPTLVVKVRPEDAYVSLKAYQTGRSVPVD